MRAPFTRARPRHAGRTFQRPSRQHLLKADVMTIDRFVPSTDGTRICYRQDGAGLGLLLIHGGSQSAEAFKQLTQLLAANFTVYRIERRGHPPSGDYGSQYGIDQEVEDVRAIVEETGTEKIFGLSVGALIALRAARALPQIREVALYEPPLEIAGMVPSPLASIPAYEAALAADNKAWAFVAALKGIDDHSFMTLVPDFLLEMAFGWTMAMKPPGSTVPAGRDDPHHALRHAAGAGDGRHNGRLSRLGGGGAADGDKSRPFFAPILDALGATLPHTSRVCISGTGHLGPSGEGQPAAVAAALCRFF
jgi:pimeloyl-ACP methyl ester carboxylesterase